MNKVDLALLNAYEEGITQRDLSFRSGFSLGAVNSSLSSLKKNKFIIKDQLNKKLISNYKVKNAIILAAGYGLRMMPLDKESPKALIEIKGERLIERLIKQLRKKDINDIYIVVGFQKEKFEYLIDLYNVKLIVNEKYTNDSNCISLLKASKYLSHSYIIPADLYLVDNIFNYYEDESWYSLSDIEISKGYYYQSRNHKLIKGKDKYYDAVGVAFISKTDAKRLLDNVSTLVETSIQSYWEDALFLKGNEIPLNVFSVQDDRYYEINTYNDLVKLDSNSDSLTNSNIKTIEELFNVSKGEIKNVQVSKKGMTNKSFTFEVNKKKYIMRIPGEGTDKLINRHEEYQVYQLLKPYNITDNVLYMDPTSGVKITEFIPNSHNCDIANWNEIALCMSKLKEFHNLKLQVDFEFDLYKQINYYESLRGDKSLYEDYQLTKERCIRLKSFVDDNREEYQLCHIDSVPDNFVITDKDIKLIDWEYAANQDPHLDIAMFIIYSGFSKEEADKLIDIYFDGKVEETICYKIYSYIALAGLLWSNWCEYKHTLGIEFGEYSLNQYRYAKVYSKIVLSYLGDDYE